MPDIQAVSATRHQRKMWLSPTNFQHVANQSVAPLVVSELVRALWSLPFGFIAEAETFKLMAIMSLEPDNNLLVDNSGKWIGRYMPQAYRAYPFLIAQSETSEKLLCVDENSGLVVDADSEGSEIEALKRFYTDTAQPTEALTKMKNFLAQYSVDREKTESICEQLQNLELIVPWPIKAVTSAPSASTDTKDEGNATTINGIYCIDEQALNTLGATELLELRDSGALLAAYLQLLSRNNLQALANLANSLSKGNQPSELMLDQVDSGGSLSFENL